MLSIGLSEILLIAVVAIVIVGPERLPHVMRELGRWYGQLRRAADELRRAFVLEADRQDAETRYSKLQDRRRVAAEARKKAMESAGKGAVAHATDLPAPDPTAVDREVRAPETPPAPETTAPSDKTATPPDAPAEETTP